MKTNPLVIPLHAVSSANAYRLASNGELLEVCERIEGCGHEHPLRGELAPLCGRKENGSTRCSEKAWRVDKPLEKWAGQSLTQPKGTRARTIIVIMVVPWLVGFLRHVGGSLIYLLLIVAVIVLIITLIQDRREL